MSNNVKDSTIYNVGDLVILSIPESKVKYRIGMILYCNCGYASGNIYSVMGIFNGQQFTVYKEVQSDNIKPISTVVTVRNEVIEKYENLTMSLNAQLLSVDKVEKDKEVLDRYNDIRKRIIKNCEMIVMSDYIDDDSFIYRVTEVANLKKQLLASGKFECVKEVSRHNERIKRECRELKVERDNILKELSNDTIESIRSYIN